MKRKEEEVLDLPVFPPATSDKERDIQMSTLAYNLAEYRMRNNTASSQEVVYFLKLGSQETKLALEQAEEENKLLRAKTAALEQEKKERATYDEVLKALQKYSGYAYDNPGEEENED